MRKLIHTRAIHRKINQRISRTHEPEQNGSYDNSEERIVETWETRNHSEEIQKRESPIDEHIRRKTHKHVVHRGEGESSHRITHGQHLITQKLNSRIYTLQRSIRRKQMYPIFQDWGEPEKTQQPTNNDTQQQKKSALRKLEIETTCNCINRTNAQLMKINQKLQHIRTTWSTRKNR